MYASMVSISCTFPNIDSHKAPCLLLLCQFRIMVPTGSDEGPRNATTTRSGFILVSTYSWTVITVVVLVARFWQGHNHKVEVGLDDVAIVAATVGQSMPLEPNDTDLFVGCVYRRDR
jgi:hypothetical protein